MSYPKSDHFDGKRFHNLERRPEPKMRDLFKWKLSNRSKPWPSSVENRRKPEFGASIAENQTFVTLINHSTFVVQTKEANYLTDPMFSERAGPLSLLGPKRRREPGTGIYRLPKIDYVLLSHNHYDHMDLSSLELIDRKYQPLFIVPLGNGKILQKVGIKKIIELDWWQTFQSVTLTPAHHWSQRTAIDYCKQLWGGFLITTPHLKIFFAGDTGFSSHFQAIEEKLGKMDVAILPIGAYEPRWFMKEHHMNPEEAVLVHNQLKADLSIAMHYGTFQLTDEGIDDPITDLKESLKRHNVADDRFIAPENGQTIVYSKAPRLLPEAAC